MQERKKVRKGREGKGKAVQMKSKEREKVRKGKEGKLKGRKKEN